MRSSIIRSTFRGDSRGGIVVRTAAQIRIHPHASRRDSGRSGLRVFPKKSGERAQCR
jgi:hypothetical protein